MALPIRLRPQLTQAINMEKSAMIMMACQGFSLSAQPEIPLRSRPTGGEQAKM